MERRVWRMESLNNNDATTVSACLPGRIGGRPLFSPAAVIFSLALLLPALIFPAGIVAGPDAATERLHIAAAQTAWEGWTLQWMAGLALLFAGLFALASWMFMRMRRLEGAMEHQARHDALTGLPNRAQLLDRLRQAIHADGDRRTPLTLIVMDLDRFKGINDALGHHVGDLVLQQVGARLRELLRPADTMARLGGDEFALLLPETDEHQARDAARKIILALKRPCVVGRHHLCVGGSLGIAVFPRHGEDAQALIQHADTAMYAAKQSNTGYAVYDPERDRRSFKQLELENDLRDAIDGDLLELCYQPMVDLRSGTVTGVEALLRWNHPSYGVISPDVVIPIAELTGLIQPLAVWVLNTALRQCAEWRRAGLDLNIAVNLSAWNLQDPALVDNVRSALNVWKVPAARLELEITESAMMAEPERAREVVGRLNAMGIRLAIDDFGAGFSSLAYLKKLPVSSLKIDKSFILGIAWDDSDTKIVRSTIDLAHDLGLKVVAEGVESEAVRARLVTLGCDTAQGYHLSHPLPTPALVQWLRTSAARPVWAQGAAGTPDTPQEAAEVSGYKH